MQVVLFVFNGDPVCFLHVLLNAFDLKDRGYEVEIVMEGSACKLVKALDEQNDPPVAPLYRKAKEAGLIGLVCKACANKMGSLDSAVAQGLTLGEDMSGHPSIGQYLADGYRVITF